ncbi:PQQ-dependent sugar dehydrogenase [Nocardioides sp. Kera G14]|uniref:PQQ-dependent sugar dehydrogenase n=1 Tax=Nocardioides sp. Kera G14 TaxID=2884264 RepID=UPI001D0F9256|nr:PQQ-dependent sugar dehydrogenase [Nocardioides sp. Kera G14]UDY24673.1 PQQ-dependent sugar dehydrogenase [Nocardioides sp. Kera G14]
MRRRSALSLVAGLSVFALVAGCGDTSDDDPSASPTASSATTSTPARSTPAPSSSAPVSSPPPTDAMPSAKVVKTIASGLDVPWGLALLPDGSLLVSTRDDGVIHRIDLATGRMSRFGEVTGAVSNVDQGGEGGLLGIAASPTYASDHTLFAYYSTADDNRIARSTDGRRWQVILDGIPHGVHHNGGRLAFGPDGMLYVGTGESGEPSLSQDPDSMGGKILRITTAGKPAPGNPDPSSPVWTIGHRNVQGLAFDKDGRLWASEFGDHTADELNWIRKGRNYGWPDTQGRTDDQRFTSPVAQWGTEEDSPSGIAIASGAVWMAALQGERLWRIPLQGTDAGTPKGFLDGRYGRLRSVLAIDDHTLVVTTSNRDGRATPRTGDDRVLLVSVS